MQNFKNYFDRFGFEPEKRKDTLKLIFIAIAFICAVTACVIVTLKLIEKKKKKLDVLDEVDLDGDGDIDAYLVDTTGDGEADTVFMDTDNNGAVDTILTDTDGDGEPDAVYEN